MRILFYISTIKAGGAARVMTNLANQLADDPIEKNEIYLLTNFSGENEYELSNKVIRYTIDLYETDENRIKKNIRRCRIIRRWVKQIIPDIVVSFMSENDARNYFATRGLCVHTVMSVRNDPAILFRGILKNKLFKYIYSHADGVVFQTEDARKWFGSSFRTYNRIIMNQTAKKFYEEERNSYPQGIVTLGSFLPKKNHMLLIRAFSKVADEVSDDLWIYGNGKLKEDYISLIIELNLQQRVHLCDFSKEPHKILANAKLFVLSSDHEGMPNVLLEALACGVPTISTDCPCGGPRMIIKNRENGILVPISDVDALAEAMREVLLDENLQKSMSLNARKDAAQFKPDIVYHEWLDFLKKLLEEN